MSNPSDEPQIPAPPRSQPPLPPPAELISPQPPYVPLTPMMSFLERRLEALEGELAVERERAQSAQNLLKQQDAIRQEVETHLKSLTDQLRREKLERESEETKAHARGRVDALERRLDEMHQSWLSLIKESLSQREAQSQAASAAQATLAQEQAALKAEIAGAMALAKERGSLQDKLDLGSELASLARKFEEFKAGLGQTLSRLESRMAEQTAVLKEFKAEARELSQSPAEHSSSQERVIASLQAERAELLKALEQRSQELRKYIQEASAAAQLRAQMAVMARQLGSFLPSGGESERDKFLRLLKEKFGE
ncbi:MAG: hypothetical protein HY921_09775 [Elusimicrobia bacterium]|nr:hypothetical protein [Elusimicrobiota bacterium]